VAIGSGGTAGLDRTGREHVIYGGLDPFWPPSFPTVPSSASPVELDAHYKLTGSHATSGLSMSISKLCENGHPSARRIHIRLIRVPLEGCVVCVNSIGNATN